MKHDRDRKLKMVAEVYLKGLECDLSPTEAVAEAWGWKLSTARFRISESRSAGYLPLRQTGQRQTPRDAECLRLYESGLTLEEIGKQLGVTRERVRQRLNRIDPEAVERRREQIRERNRFALESERQARLKPCKLCGQAFDPQAGPRTSCCSTTCSLALRLNRYWLERNGRDLQRRRSAESILRHQDEKPAMVVRWAERYLNEQQPPNRNCHRPDSKAWIALVDAVGSARADELRAAAR